MTTTTLISAAPMSLVITALLTPAVIRLARRCNCYDLPGKRRFHRVKTPRWGGLAFFFGIAPVLLLLLGPDRRVLAYLAASLLLVSVGMIDDRRPLGWKGKMGTIALATSLVVYGGGIVLRDLGTFGGPQVIGLGLFAVPFTFFCVVGVTNALNMIDGLNGLSTGVSILAFLLLGVAAAVAGNLAVALICFSFSGALLGFLGFNFPRARIFMGDSGSMYLGFSLAVISILLTQDARYPVDPLYPVAVLFLPIVDALRIMIVRIMRKKSPFMADKGHLHHLIVRNGVSSYSAVALLWAVMAVAGAVAFAVRHSSLALLTLVLVYASGMVLAAGALVERKVGRRNERKERPAEPVPVPLLPVLVYPSRQDMTQPARPVAHPGPSEAVPATLPAAARGRQRRNSPRATAASIAEQ